MKKAAYSGRQPVRQGQEGHEDHVGQAPVVGADVCGDGVGDALPRVVSGMAQEIVADSGHVP